MILVLGGNGFLGKNTVEKLTESDFTFISPTREELDLFDPASVTNFNMSMITGIINLDTELRNTLRSMLVEGVDSIKSSAKLAGVENVAIAPISGDIDGYVRSLSEDVLAQTNLMPVRLSAGTIGEARQSLRDNPNQADAILTGAVRDLSRTLDSTQLLKAVYEINAEVQLRIESVKDGSVLWSQTFAVTNTDVEEETEWDFIKRNKLYLALVGGAAVLFILFLLFLNATRRSR